jgi:hypothetical protein
VKLEAVPAGQGEGALLPEGQNEPSGQGKQVLNPALPAVAKRPAAHDEGGAGGFGLVKEGGEGDGLGGKGSVHTKGQP